MGTTKDYIPKKIADFFQFVVNLMQVLALHVPGAARPWGYTLAQLNSLNDDVNDFKEAYNVANPAGKKQSRTLAQVATMNEKKATSEKSVREFVNRWLAFNPLVLNSDKKDMNLTVFDTEPSPVPVPDFKPFVFKINTSEPAQHKLSVRKEGSSKRGLPEGVHGLEVVYKIGGDAPATPDDCPNQALPTRSIVKISFNMSDSGKRVYYFMRYLNTKNQPGPWSIMFSAIVQ